MKLRGAVLTGAVLILPIFPAFAGVITPPTGLTPGEGYHLIFITSTQEAATSTNIADYNAYVQTVADSQPDLAALNLTWYAYASTPFNDNYDDISEKSDPVYSLDGTLVESSLYNTTELSVPTFEDGSAYDPSLYSEPYVWTGSGSNGARYCGGNCALGKPNAAYGDPTNANLWLLDSLTPDTTPLSFYAVSSELTFDPAPEPGTLSMGAFGALTVALLLRRGKRSARGRGQEI